VFPAVPHRAAAQTRRRLRAGHRAEPVVCRCRFLPQRARSLALQWCRTFVPTSARRVPARRRHPRTEHTTVERRPCLSLAWGRVSTNPCRAHVVGVVPSPRLCRRPLTRTHQHQVEALSFLVEPVHAHSRTREVVRRRMSPTNAAGPFLAVFPFSVPLPSARHQFCVAAMAEPSAFGTHTYARNRGAEPLLHLSVTVLDVPSCRRREPQCTGARVSVEPSTPSSNLSATSILNTASPKSAR
jgi:hypothetical protein